ncbi:MAG: hypothetical protein IPO21_03560 [Bacteroidales bacterium]|nr:hypothetical protein [Bacteroidales bacterium]
MAQVISKKTLNKNGSEKETIHIELSLKDSGLQYKPGDSLGVYSKNNPQFVDEIIQTLKFDKYEPVWTNNKNRSFRYALIEELEITRLRPEVVSAYSKYSKDVVLHSIEKNETDLAEYCKNRDLLDLIEEFPTHITPQELVLLLRKLPPRLYSIASSQSMYPNEVHLTIGVVRYSKNNRDHEGVCSTFMSDRIDNNLEVPVYIRSTPHFRLPSDDTAPIIMIGPGTGIAPFRAFIQERIAKNATGKNWLFFGDRNSSSDFLYEDELVDYHKKGILTNLSLAFSRDQEKKIYVQNKMMERAAELYNWIEEGATIYICGDKINMAQDVKRAVLNILIEEGQMTVADAYMYLNQLIAQKRYLEDVY